MQTRPAGYAGDLEAIIRNAMASEMGDGETQVGGEETQMGGGETNGGTNFVSPPGSATCMDAIGGGKQTSGAEGGVEEGVDMDSEEEGGEVGEGMGGEVGERGGHAGGGTVNRIDVNDNGGWPVIG